MVQRNQLSLLVVLFSAGLLPWLRVQAAEDEPVEYGVDVVSTRTAEARQGTLSPL
jgi:hypothetical protein